MPRLYFFKPYDSFFFNKYKLLKSNDSRSPLSSLHLFNFNAHALHSKVQFYVYISFHKICRILQSVLRSLDLRFILIFPILNKISILTTMSKSTGASIITPKDLSSHLELTFGTSLLTFLFHGRWHFYGGEVGTFSYVTQNGFDFSI